MKEERGEENKSFKWEGGGLAGLEEDSVPAPPLPVSWSFVVLSELNFPQPVPR